MNAMDPTATWKKFLNHLVEDELGDTVVSLDDLRTWLAKRGHPPDGMTYPEACALTDRLATASY
jgi:hypothetical protein